MPVTRAMLLSELQDLLRLTSTEQAIATVRRAQARTQALEDELAQNARKAGERIALLRSAIRSLDGVPDAVGLAVGKAGAFATAQLNQVQTLPGALLGDLALEHQLRERARYARSLATTLDESAVVPVLDRLETAHTATIDWLEARLAEVAATGTSLLRATPAQAAVASVRRAAAGPLLLAAQGVNRAAAFMTGLAGRAPQPLQEALGRTAHDVAGALRAGVDAGAHASRAATARTEDGVTAAAAGAHGLLDEAQQRLGDVAGRVAAAATDARDTVKDTVAETVTDAGDTVHEAAKNAGNGVRDTVGDAVGGPVRDAGHALQGAVQDAARTADQAAGQAADQAGGQASEHTVDLTGTGDVAAPFAGYDALPGDRVMGHVNDTEDVAELEQLLAYERAHKARKGVLQAVRERLTALSASA